MNEYSVLLDFDSYSQSHRMEDSVRAEVQARLTATFVVGQWEFSTTKCCGSNSEIYGFKTAAALKEFKETLHEQGFGELFSKAPHVLHHIIDSYDIEILDPRIDALRSDFPDSAGLDIIKAEVWIKELKEKALKRGLSYEQIYWEADQFGDLDLQVSFAKKAHLEAFKRNML